MKLRNPVTLLFVALLLAACSSGPLASGLPSNLPTLPSRSAAASAAPSVAASASASAAASAPASAEASAIATPEATTSASVAPSESAAAPSAIRRERAPSPLAVCGPIESLSTQDAGPPDAEHGQPRLPAVVGWRSQTRSTRTSPPVATSWENGDPYSMEGYEGATAYAIANAMGFTPDKVDWIANTVFAQAFAPGPKPFDFHMAQISIRPKRALNVDFSDPYFDANQARPCDDAECNHRRSEHQRPEGVQARGGSQHDELRPDRAGYPADGRAGRLPGQQRCPDRRSRTARSTASSST